MSHLLYVFGLLDTKDCFNVERILIMKKIVTVFAGVTLSLILGGASLVHASNASTASEDFFFRQEEDGGVVIDPPTPTNFKPTPVKYDSGWKHWQGGKWRHGVGTKYVWSHFDHNSKKHETHVKGLGGEIGYSGWQEKGDRASASWEKAPAGNKAWANVE